MKFPPTAQQQAIIDAFRERMNIVVQALAGTGKTTTLQLLAALFPQLRFAYVAFNKSIAAEAASKFGHNVTAKTSHGFARAAMIKGPLKRKVAQAEKRDGWPELWAAILGITRRQHGDRLIEAKRQAAWVMAAVTAFRQSDAPAITEAHLPAALHEPGMADLREPILAYVRRAWADKASPRGQLPFVHDDYLKLWALSNPRLPFNVIVLDEAQDTNPVVAAVIQAQSAQIVVVGDSNQSIYGFRGAVDALRDWPADVVLPLTQSWRFGQAIADVGNAFLRLIGSPYLLEANPGIDSRVGPFVRSGFDDQHCNWIPQGGGSEPDAVLAFTNAGCVAAVFEGFEAGKKVALIGGGDDIKAIAKAAQDLVGGRRTKHPDLARFKSWAEVQEYVDEHEEAQSLRTLVRLVDKRGADELIRMADALIPEEATREDGTPAYDLTVCTIHKSKGLEWDRVRIAGDAPHPEEDLATGKVTLPSPEQLRLSYVAVTRGRVQVDLGGLEWIRDWPMEQLLDLAGKRAGGPTPAAAPEPAPVPAPAPAPVVVVDPDPWGEVLDLLGV